MDKNFNIIITGVGGQGIITLVSILDEACLVEGYDVKSSELHGLSQRGGSVIVHVRFGKRIYSPLVQKGGADLLIGLELLEGLRGAVFAGKNAKFLINNHVMPFMGGMPENEILGNFKKLPQDNLHLINAFEICKKELGKEVVSGIYLLGCAVKNNLIPIKEESFVNAIKSIVPEKYLDLNIKAFNLAFKQ